MMTKLKSLALLSLPLMLTACATSGPYQASTPERAKQVEAARKSLPLNPKHWEAIWSGIKVGMTVKEVMDTLPNAKFDDQWSAVGTVGVMAEAGILATDKIKVTAEIIGPFKTLSTLYVVFDEAERCDGIVIGTITKDLPPETLRNYGTIGFYLPEFKEAAKAMIRYGLPELGVRKGPPKLGRDPVDSLSVGAGIAVSPNTAVGIGIPALISPATISQTYERPGFKSLLSTRSMYLELYNVYAAPIVFMSIQAKQADDIEDVQ